MANNKFIKGLTEKTSILADDWQIMQPDAEESIAYKIKKSNLVSATANIWQVSTSGNDTTGNGSAEYPYKTFGKVHTVASSNDVVLIQNASFSSSTPLTFTKSLIIIGPANNDHGIFGATISGSMSLSSTLTLINVKFTCSVTLSTSTAIIVKNCYFNPTSLSGRLATLTISNSTHFVKTASQLYSLDARDVYFEGGNLLSVGRGIEVYNSVIDGAVTAGIDVSSTCISKNTTIKGALTVTGDLETESSTILGGATVSGTITGGNVFAGQSVPQSKIVSYSATPTFDLNDGNSQQMTLTGNITTFTVSNQLTGGRFEVYLVNDGTAGRTVAAPTGWTADPSSETHTTAANAINMYQFYTLPDGSKYYNIHIVKA